MDFVVRNAGRDREVVLRVHNPEATVGDLGVVLGGHDWAGRSIAIGDHVAQPDIGLDEAGLYEGACVQRADTAPPVPPAATLELCVVGGTTAGEAFPLRPGPNVIGRNTACDIVLAAPTVSRRHCRVEVDGTAARIIDLESSSGTIVDGKVVAANASMDLVPTAVVSVGDFQFVVRPRRSDDRPMAVDPLRFVNAAGEIPFNRPPRTVASAEAQPIPAPRPPQSRPRPAFNLIAIVSPAIFGLVMVIATGNVLYALSALLSPVMAVGNWVDARRRSGKDARSGQRSFRDELETFGSVLRRTCDEERLRRRAQFPDAVEVVRRAALPSVRLWERRPGDGDFLKLSAGHTDLDWDIPLTDVRTAPDTAVTALIAANRTLPTVPIPVDLSQGGVVGIVGDREGALALARNLLCQAAVFHGPSDVLVLVLVDTERVPAWDWTKWLPHVRDPGGGDVRMTVAGQEQCESFLRAIVDGARRDQPTTRGSNHVHGPVLLAVMDSERLTEGRDAPARALLRGKAGPAAGIVIAATEDRLPAMCTTIIDVRASDGLATLTRPREGVRVEDFVCAGMSESTARRCGRELARFEDSEVHVPGAGLPDRVAVLPLLGLTGFDPDLVRQRWRSQATAVAGLASADPNRKPPLKAPIGVGESGIVSLDLVNDGPHGLIGGTTGSGKSELLRSLVLGLAATNSPEFLNFVLIDFKGGAAFEGFERLPHTVGMATNLDAQLAERALRCLQSELRYRQRQFRKYEQVDELHRYWMVSSDPLPRLVVIIDEFAEMANALPDFLATLISIGRIGRTLGVHLVLATQRPSGVVTQDLKENTNWAVALRVREAANSIDVIGVPDALSIPVSATGRAYLRVGGATGSSPTLFQSAFASATTLGDIGATVEVAPFAFAMSAQSAFDAKTPLGGRAAPSDVESDLTRLVEAIRAGFESEGRPPPRRPWTDPLPDIVPLDQLVPLRASPRSPASGPTAPAGSRVPRLPSIPFALADDLDGQAQRPAGWDLSSGNLLLYGVLGSGTTTALASIALAAARTLPPDNWCLYVLDCGGGELAALNDLPTTGAAVTSAETERQQRMVGYLLQELDERKQSPSIAASRPVVLVMIDNFSGLVAAGEGVPGLMDGISRIFGEGPGVGILTAATGDRPAAIPLRLADLAPQKWVMRLSDKSDYGIFGLPKQLTANMVPGRALIAGSSLVVQVGCPTPPLAKAVAAQASAQAPPRTRPNVIGVLPSATSWTDLPAIGPVGADPWYVPIGISAVTLQSAGWNLNEGDNVLVAGPSRSGKSSFLASLVPAIRRGLPDLSMIAVIPRRSPLATCSAFTKVITDDNELQDVLASLEADPSPCLVVIDDAHEVGDPGGQLAGWIKAGRAGRHIICAGRSDELRSAYGHWTQLIRKSRTGLILRANQASDGDVLSVTLPFRSSIEPREGRGYLVNDGVYEIVQTPLT